MTSHNRNGASAGHPNENMHLEPHDGSSLHCCSRLLEDTSTVGSFVVRCRVRQDADGAGDWRIRITFVQGQEEQTVASWEEAVGFMQLMMKRGNEAHERE